MILGETATRSSTHPMIFSILIVTEDLKGEFTAKAIAAGTQVCEGSCGTSFCAEGDDIWKRDEIAAGGRRCPSFSSFGSSGAKAIIRSARAGAGREQAVPVCRLSA